MSVALISFLVLFLHLFFLSIVAADSCPASIFSCGMYNLTIDYPFYTNISGSGCQGIYLIQCSNLTPLIKFPGQDFRYPIHNISYHDRTLIIHDLKLSLSSYQWGSDCAFLYDFKPPIDKANVTELSLLISSGQESLFNSKQTDPDFNQSIFSKFYNSSVCRNYDLYYTRYSQTKGLPAHCSASGTSYFSWKLLFSEDGTDGWGFSLVSAGFSYDWELQPECFDCRISGGHSCVRSCSGKGSNSRSKMMNIIIGATIAIGGFILVSVVCLLCYRQKKRVKYSPSTPLVRTISPDKSFRKDLDLSYSNYPTHIFSYSELDDATNSFDDSQQIGDGGFGIVYKGKLKDGRIVAVKRLYENSYKGLQQFINEIEILSRLRHPNLVSLYGCTSHRSQELLLLCEYVPNGTVADHLHGVRVAEQALCWHLRLKIAIETAEALAYLHAIEPLVIHRDVKTSNILLDNSFHVKVADFGLSRLVPTDATHISTAPQGTPGYLDPEYHQCYQLTDKSDVYSFGVVLVELISSKQAVDINRHRNEINLASMAISKIQSRTLEQLVDPGLGYQSDCKKKRMITQVAELAFRCLQMDSELRPSIREVLEFLKAIENDRYKTDEAAESDVRILVDDCLSMKANPFSPNSVTEKWDSRTTTMSNNCSVAT